MYQTVTKDKKSVSRNLFIGLMIFSALLIVSFGIYSYLNQIYEVKDVSIRVKQFQEAKLPEMLPAKLRNHSYKNVKVKWETDKLDTQDAGKEIIRGKVDGFKKDIIAVVDVYEYINKVEPISKRVMVNTTKIDLPEKVYVTKSNGDIGTEKVKWDTSGIDTKKEGNMEIKGTIISKFESDVTATCDLKILSKQGVLGELITSNYDKNNNEISKSNELIKNLPNNILTKILEDKVKIEYISHYIEDTSNPNGTLKLVGIYYPATTEIKVDYAIPRNIINKYNNCSISTLHEIGHAFDYNKVTGKFDESADLDDASLNKKEGPNLFTSDFSTSKELIDYFINSPTEYFAECFAYYYANSDLREVLKNRAPLTYEYIKKVTDGNN